MKTKGALIWEFNQPWSIEEIEVGDPAPNEVKVQMEASGMCHSDHHLVTGGIPMLGFPVLGGHEGAGIVMVVHETSVVKIDPSIPFEVACLVGCGVTTGYGSATHTAQIKPGEDVAIVGVGGVGMAALQAAVLSGARNVFVIDPVEWKRDQALKFGATHVYEDINAALMGIAEATAGFMAKKVIVTVGELHGADVENYMMITAKSGTCVVTAIGSMVDTNVTLNLAMLTLMQKNLQGTIFGGGNPYHDIPQLLSMYKAGKLNLDDMITRQYRLDQINEGYQDMLEGRNIRGVIRYTDEDR